MEIDIVWSHGRYDFVYDEDAGALRISHRYSHKRIDTKSVSSIARQMIDFAIDYLEEIKTSAKKDAAHRTGHTGIAGFGVIIRLIFGQSALEDLDNVAGLELGDTSRSR